MEQPDYTMDYKTKQGFDLGEIKNKASGRELEILEHVAGIDAELLDGKREHPCPKCGGNTRFRMIDAGAGAVRCSHCFNEKCGDYFAAVQWMRGITFQEALAEIGEYLDVASVNRGKITATNNCGLKSAANRWMPQSNSLDENAVGEWCRLHKKGIGVSGVKQCGGVTDVYRNKPVLCLPMYGNDLDTITGWALYHLDGTPIGDKKILNAPGSKSGIIGTIERLRQLSALETIFKVEGVSDAISLASAIPENKRDKIAVFANGCGAGENPDKTPFRELIAKIGEAGCEFIIVGDNDGPGKDGLKKWADYASGQGCKVWTVNLPETMFDAPIKDVRDYFIGGETFADLNHLAKPYAADSTDGVTKSAPAKTNPKAKTYKPNLIDLSQVEEMPINWLWYNKIPLEMVTVFAGRQGCGKTFWSTYLAAKITHGGTWHDGTDCPKGSVLFFYGEDLLDKTMVPRLKAQGADLSKIRVLDGLKELQDGEEVGEKGLTILDVDFIREAIKGTAKETGEPVRMVVVDPISNYWGKTKENDNSESRQALNPIQRLAEEMGVAFLLITHFGKGQKEEATDKIIGSVAITAVARTTWHLYRDNDRPDHRLFVPGKDNILVDPTGVEFVIERNRGGQVEIVTSDLQKTANDVEEDNFAYMRDKMNGRGRKPEQSDSAKEWLEDFLMEGRRPVGSETDPAEGDRKSVV